MRSAVFIILLVFFSPILSKDGEEDGRRGNELYEQAKYDLAAQAYRDGLAALGANASAQLRYALENNLGAALLKSGDVAGARDAFARALASAPEQADVARSSYNAGNADFSGKELENALANYREALLRDPSNQDAKFNYEFVKRQLEQQQQSQQQQQQQSENPNEERQEQEQDSPGDQKRDQQQQEQQQQQQNQQNQEQREGEQQESSEGEQPKPESRPSPNELSEEQAERILQALQNEEEKLLREVERREVRPRRVEKDW